MGREPATGPNSFGVSLAFSAASISLSAALRGTSLETIQSNFTLSLPAGKDLVNFSPPQ